ncbi:MAG: acyltransferase [Clostridia bacterium]|nr:acyltransferase [Clostridia bacterium]
MNGQVFIPRVGRAPDERRIDVLDGVRTIMILLVGWFHIWQQSWLTPSVIVSGRYYSLDPLLRSGYIWVDGMILLSGFLLYYTYGGRPMGRGDVLRFYRKRFARIFPSYALNVLIFFFLNLHRYADTAHALWDLGAHLTFTHPLWYFTYYGSPINGALWTVGVEFQFYLLFPLVLYLYRKKPGWTFAGMCLIGWGFRYWAASLKDCGMAFNQLPAFMDVYAIGFLGAGAYLALREKLREEGAAEKGFFLLTAAVCVLFLSRLVKEQASRGSQEMIRYGQLVTRLPLALALTALIISLAFTFRPVRFLFGSRVMRVLSEVSFQFYMYHQVLAVIIRENRWIPSVSDTPNYVGEWPWQPVYTLVCFLVPLVLSVILTYCFEKPLARLILRRSGEKTLSAAGKAEENKGVDAT